MLPKKIIDLYTQKQQGIILKASKQSEEEFFQDLLHYRDITDYLAWELSSYIKKYIPFENTDIYHTTACILTDRGFEYQWHKKALSQIKEDSYRELFSAIQDKGIDYSHIIINKTPVDKEDILLDYGDYCEVFYFNQGLKTNLEKFEDYKEAQKFYADVLLSKEANFFQHIHYNDDEQKALLLFYAHKLNDPLSYKILNEEIQIDNDADARHLSLFFWEMTDAAVDDYHKELKEGIAMYSEAEALMNIIGGFIVHLGYKYEWYREDLSPKRLKDSKKLIKHFEKEIAAKNITINSKPLENSWCFLDYGDSCECFYFKDNDTHELKEFHEDHKEAIEYFISYFDSKYSRKIV